MVVKNSYIPVSRLKTETGEVYKDQEQALYFADHEHEALAGKEFCNIQEAYQAIQDYNAKAKEPFKGELILLNVIQFD